jgi:glyoxylase-like metal-dependent hydrolase (beta-lactamase superfamily II)
VSRSEITENLTRIVHRRVFNCYLLREEDGFTLIDVGPPGAAPIVLDALRLAHGELRRIVLTHAHRDHVGGLDHIVRALNVDLEIVAGRREAALLSGDFTPAPGETTPARRSRSYGHPREQPTRLVDDGDRICSLEVIATPGHTPGHLSLIDTRDRTLISGDAITTLGRTAVSGDLVLRWPFPALSTWNKAHALSSARRLLEEQPGRLASGHGPPLDDAMVGLRRAIAEAR